MPQRRTVYGPGVTDAPGLAGWAIALIIGAILLLALGGFAAAGVIRIDTALWGLRGARENARTDSIYQQQDYIDARTAAANGYLRDFDRLGRMTPGFAETKRSTWTTSQHQDVGYMCAEASKLTDENVRQWFDPRIRDLMALEGCRRV